jgi:phosphoenolpyruvate---glycerone phosphotransferase subunit DhaL
MTPPAAAPDVPAAASRTEGTSSMIDVIEAWLRLAASRIHERAPELTALDQAIGDGDHGINLDRGFTAVAATLDSGRPEADGERATAGALLRSTGRTLISTVGGASGPLYGTAFMRAGAAVAAADAGASTADVLVAALEAGIGGIEALGKATIGEKTMLDALVPAARAGREAAGAGSDGIAVLAAFADAAESGAAATIPLLATKGRASYLGERSIGHQDPGATSAALLLRALADASAGTAA